MKKVTVVFPMAGEGQRFGSKFKPFMKIFDKTFIELAIEPFLKHADKITRFVFIFRGDHNLQFDVIKKLDGLKLPVKTSMIGVRPTKNVIQTISTLFVDSRILGDVVFCDCDHSLNVDSFFDAIAEDKYDCIIPGWHISPEEVSKWSIASVDEDNMVNSIAEKKWPDNPQWTFGVIGCYYFKQLYEPALGNKYLSDVIGRMVKNGKAVKLVEVTEAEFFGDPQRLNNLYVDKLASTVFCDLDGTIIEHENVPDYSKKIRLLDGAKDKIDEWRRNNVFIVLTTARDEQFRPEMEVMLRKAGIHYEYLIMGLPPGPRYLINDKKPLSSIPMANAIEVDRNKGIATIGYSFAEFQRNGDTLTKCIENNAGQHQMEKLKAQYNSMMLIKVIPGLEDLLPMVTDFTGNGYRIEYLSEYTGLHTLDPGDRINTLNTLFQKLRLMYDFSRQRAHRTWLEQFMEEKIFSREKIIEQLGLGDQVLEKLHGFNNIILKYLSPDYLSSHFHGDLTYENIMVKDGDIKLIDFDNDDKAGPVELDLGKLMQSVYTGYESWDDGKTVHINGGPEADLIVKLYSSYLQQDVRRVTVKARFYCVLHLIRMIPYQARRSERRAKLAYKWAQYLLSLIKL